MQDTLAASSMDILLEGEWKPGSIVATFEPGIKRPTTPSVEQQIARDWAAAELEAVQHDRLLFPGPLVRVLHYERRSHALCFRLGPTDYREYIGTKSLEDAEFRADPLTACAAVRTADGKIVVGRRGHRNMENAGWWHLIGGYVDPTHDRAGDGIDVFGTILREIEEEVGFPRHEVSAVCLGLVRWRPTHKPELIFFVQSPRTSAEIRPADDEHEEIRPIHDHPDAIQEFLEQASGRIAGPGVACLVRYAAWRHSTDL